MWLRHDKMFWNLEFSERSIASHLNLLQLDEAEPRVSITYPYVALKVRGITYKNK